MNELKKVSHIVREILEENTQTRNSDSYLYLKVLEHEAKEKGVNLYGISVPMFLSNMKDYGFTGFETVRRTRQKIQQHNPNLCACENVESYRSEKEQEFKAFAIGEFKC